MEKKKYIYEFNKPIIGKFLKREKRFISYFSYNNEIIKAHCCNTGKMTDLLIEGSECLLSQKENGNMLYTWEAIKINDVWIGINTTLPNKAFKYIYDNKIIPVLTGVNNLQSEKLVKIEDKKYKPDFSNEEFIIEVKNVHWIINDFAYFPDCITERGTNQLKFMENIYNNFKKKCIIIYILQRHDIEKISIHPKVDEKYFQQLTKMYNKKIIEVFAFNVKIDEKGILFNKTIKFFL